MENKVIQHIVKNKFLYFILIALIGFAGIFSLDLSPSSQDSALQGNVEELIVEDKSSNLTLSTPAEGSKFAEGDTIKIQWDYPGGDTGITYRVFAQEKEDPTSPEISIAKGLAEKSTEFSFPYNTLSAEQKIKTYVITVAIEGKDLAAHATVTLVDQDQITFVQPESGVKFSEGDTIVFAWQNKTSTTGMSYRLDLVNVNNAEDRMAVEKNIPQTETKFTVPFDFLTSEDGVKTYQAMLQVLGEELVIMGPTFSVIDKQEQEEDTSLIPLIPEESFDADPKQGEPVISESQPTKEDDPSVTTEIAQDDPSVTTEIAQDDPSVTTEIAQDDPSVTTEIVQDDPSVSTDTENSKETLNSIKNPTFNKTPLQSNDPLVNVPGFERI